MKRTLWLVLALGLVSLPVHAQKPKDEPAGDKNQPKAAAPVAAEPKAEPAKAEPAKDEPKAPQPNEGEARARPGHPIYDAIKALETEEIKHRVRIGKLSRVLMFGEMKNDKALLTRSQAAIDKETKRHKQMNSRLDKANPRATELFRRHMFELEIKESLGRPADAPLTPEEIKKYLADNPGPAGEPGKEDPKAEPAKAEPAKDAPKAEPAKAEPAKDEPKAKPAK